MASRNPENNRARGHAGGRSGAMSIQFLVIMVPVLFGFMGFALDLGRIYLIRAELNQAASAMAFAAAARLNGTLGATDFATAASNLTLDNSLGDANRYNFGSLIVGQPAGILNSVTQDPAYFPTQIDAITALGQFGAASIADGTTARHVTINLTADAPLLFWSILALGQSRATSIAASAVAGVSAPVCTACGIEPFAVPRRDPALDDLDNFGFVAGTVYTFGSQCNGAPPANLAGTTGRVPYLLLDRYDTGQTFTEDQQLFRNGAQGLTPSPVTPGWSCATIGNVENVWATALPGPCAGPAQQSVIRAMCGLSARFTDPTQVAACANGVTDVATITAAYTPDVDIADVTDYTVYVGDNKRLMTVAIVDALSTAGAMQIVGFRQFLVNPTANSATGSNNPADVNGRFAAIYLGVVAPLRQGTVGGQCGITSGPGKVVLHR